MSYSTKNLQVKTTSETFEYWLEQPFISNELRNLLSGKTLLLTPQNGHGDSEVLCFPTGTEDLLRFLRDNQTEDLSVDICIEDEDYRELSLHSDLLILAGVIMTLVAAPVAVNVISHWIIKRLGSRVEQTDLKCEITVVDNNRSIHFKYDGAASAFRETLLNALNDTNTGNIQISETPEIEPPLLQASTGGETVNKEEKL